MMGEVKEEGCLLYLYAWLFGVDWRCIISYVDLMMFLTLSE